MAADRAQRNGQGLAGPSEAAEVEDVPEVRYELILGLILSLIAAEVSWRVVEIPFPRIKVRFAQPA